MCQYIGLIQYEAQDVKLLMWGQRIWVFWPISNNKSKGLVEEENVWGWLRKVHNY